MGFSGGRDYQLSEQAVVATLGRRFGERLTLNLSGGAILGGTMREEAAPEREFDVGTGWVAAVTAGYRFVGGGDQKLFVVGTLGISFSRTTTESSVDPNDDVTLTAQDTRLGAQVGYTLWQAWSPYAVARIFGGPVSWEVDGESVTGSDRNKYTVGVGSAFALPGGFGANLEGNFLGERSINANLNFSF